MKPWALAFALAVGARGSSGAVVTFDGVAVGTQWGAPAQAPGDLVHTEDGIDVRVTQFRASNGQMVMHTVRVEGPNTSFPTRHIFTGNTGLRLEFGGLDQPVTHVTIDVRNNGGYDNLAVNGSALYVGLIGNAPSSLGGVAVSVSPPGNPPTGIQRLTFTGPIGSITIGGQELMIDNIAASRVCGTADFDCDGDTGTDADIQAFFACLAGACPAGPCASNADFNFDGDTGTDADIEAFFRVLAGGAC